MEPTTGGVDPEDGESAAMRLLRRRYDLLRDEYEDLLDRLGELERRIERTPAVAPPGGGLVESVQAPLARLRDEYRLAAREVQRILDGLETVVAGQMKPQRGATPRPLPREDDEIPAREHAPGATPHQVHVDVRGHGYRQLLRFQQLLEGLPGVDRVAISAMDPERATFIVELADD